MSPVDTWRAINRLEGQGWNEDAIANALALPVRTVKKLKLLGQLHPPMLDVMAKGSMPSDEHLRTIANAPLADQEQVWKKLKPRKGHEASWWDIARALHKTRVPFSAAKFDEKLAEEYGVVWHEDLFAQPDEDSRYTTNAEGFFAAQEAWMRDNLPTDGRVLTIDEFGQPELPKRAERVWGNPGKHDKIGYFVNPRSGEVQTIAYREPEPKNGNKAKKSGRTETDASPTGATQKVRPDVTEKGRAIIGDYRTDALHQALRDAEIDDSTLIGLLVLALAGRNVTVQSGTDTRQLSRKDIITPIIEGGVLTADHATVRAAARSILGYALSCRANMSNSGVVALLAGAAIGADRHLPHMATDEFLSCLSRQALERSATQESVAISARVKDTRAALIKRFDGGAWHFPAALFAVTPEQIAEELTPWDRDDYHHNNTGREDEDHEGSAGPEPETSDPDNPGHTEPDQAPDGEAYPFAAD